MLCIIIFYILDLVFHVFYTIYYGLHSISHIVYIYIYIKMYMVYGKGSGWEFRGQHVGGPASCVSEVVGNLKT